MNNGASAIIVIVVIVGWQALQRDIAPLCARMDKREGNLEILKGFMTSGKGA